MSLTKVSYSMINGAPVNVLDFGADPTGSDDSSAAFQAAVDASANVVVPEGTFLINTPVDVADNVTIQGQGSNSITIVKTTGDVNTFNVGDACYINDIYFLHEGDGIVINATQKEALHLTNNTFYTTKTASTKPAVYVSGSFAWIRNNSFNNVRADGYAISADRTAGLIHIESHIEENTFGGSGNGIKIWSSDNSARPEGFYISNNTFIGTHENLRIEQILQCSISNNVFDQGGNYNVIFDPKNTGVQNIQLFGNYFSTPNQGTTGVAVAHLNPTPGIPLSQISFTNNTFAFCGIGINILSPALDILVVGNTFTAIGNNAIGMNGVIKASIISNSFNAITTANLSLTDGAAGGPYSVDGNQFDDNATYKNIFTRTDTSKFLFGQTNSKVKLCGWSTYATDTTAKPSGSYIAIPHGLQDAPDKTKILAYVCLNTATSTVGATVNVAAVDSINVTVQLFYTLGSAGTYSVNLFASV